MYVVKGKNDNHLVNSINYGEYHRLFIIKYESAYTDQ